MSSKKISPPVPLLRSDEAFEWNVAVPFNPTCYGAKEIQSMVKLANRRGEVRWFMVEEDGKETRWRLHREPIKGVDYLEDFLSDLLEDKPQGYRDHIGNLVVSFSEQSSAKAFSRDMELLLALTDSSKGKGLLSPIETEQKRRMELAESNRRSLEEWNAKPESERAEIEAALRKATAELKAKMKRGEMP